MPINLLNFVRKWQASTHNEETGAHDHFRDLCEVLDVPPPLAFIEQDDSIGANYTYEKRVTKAGTGETGFADVWKRGWFAWEYKSKGGDLKKAYKQLNEYHESLENPPLLVVCDFDRFEIHTKFVNAPPRVFAFTLEDLLHPTDTATCALPPLDVLRHTFGDYNLLRPEKVAIPVTRAAAQDFLRLARELEIERPLNPNPPTKEQIAHFLMRLVFCLFADSVDLLPDHTFRSLITNQRHSPIGFNRALPVLFQAMSQQQGFFGPVTIPYFNGGLFSDDAIIPLNHADLGILASAAAHDWSHVEPAIFGTLFERSLDAAKRSMIGAHYTSPEDILLLIEPVVIAPLLRRWQQVQQQVLEALGLEADTFPGVLGKERRHPEQSEGSPHFANGANQSEEADHSTPSGASSLWTASSSTNPNSTNSEPATSPGAPSSPASTEKVGSRSHKQTTPTAESRPNPAAQLRINRQALNLLESWATELSQVRILDPACGSGNFLYLALKRLLDLWQMARQFGLDHGLALAIHPIPSPQQLYGIEIDFYAHEIASVVVWIGWLQWKHDHGYKEQPSPLLQRLTNIERDDAILRFDKEGKAYEPDWPASEYIIGNPPFLGGKKLRRRMSATYVDALFKIYKGRVVAESDLVVYWFEKARNRLAEYPETRVGLLATQQIRKGFNQRILKIICTQFSIFWAVSNKGWFLGVEKEDKAGRRIHKIAQVRIAMIGFDNGAQTECILDGEQVKSINPDLSSGTNVTQASVLQENAKLVFQGPVKVGKFEISSAERDFMLRQHNPHGKSNADILKPWINGDDIVDRPRFRAIIDFGSMKEDEAAMYESPFEQLRKVVKPKRENNRDKQRSEKWWRLGRSGATLKSAIAPLQRMLVTSRVSKHRFYVWMTTDVVPDTRVVVFASDRDYFSGILHSNIHQTWFLAMSSRHGVGNDPTYDTRTCFDTFPFPWPPGTEPSEADSPLVRAIADAARTLVQLRDAWLNPPGINDEDLKKKTLTNLYNQRPTWLANAHRTLDEAVFAAYGWPADLTTQEILARLLALNHQRAAAQPAPAKKKARSSDNRSRQSAPAQ